LARASSAPSPSVYIETDHVLSAINEAAGDRASHDAKPDDSNGLVHESSSGWSRREFELLDAARPFELGEQRAMIVDVRPVRTDGVNPCRRRAALDNTRLRRSGARDLKRS
jgi:hypothetical protein